MVNTSPTWMLERPWRNNNPGDLRSLGGKTVWDGQIATDLGPGGPFARFVTRTMGWRALAVCLLTYSDVHGLKTINQIIDRYAPPIENNTVAYKSLVSKHLGIGLDESTDLHKPEVMTAFVAAIAIAEGGARIVWPLDEQAVGVNLALGIVPAPTQEKVS